MSRVYWWVVREYKLFTKPHYERFFDTERRAKLSAKKLFFQKLQEQGECLLAVILKSRSGFGKRESIVIEKPTKDFVLRVGNYAIQVKKVKR